MANSVLLFCMFLLQATSKTCFGTRITVSYQIQDNNGTITQPYQKNIGRLWNITVPSGKQVKINFTYFDLMSSVTCNLDFVEIQDGHLPTSDVIVRMCGQQRSGKTLYSTSRHLQIYFETALSRFPYKGFQIFYEAVELIPSFIEGIKQERTKWAELQGRVKECRNVKVENDGELYVRVNCSSLMLSSLSALDIPNITTLLDVSNNEIHKIEGLHHLSSLVSLNLANNKIQSVENGSFANLSRLEYLNLANNRIQRVQKRNFANLPRLQNLNLAENNIEGVANGSFVNLVSLRNLDLSRNHIKRIHQKTFIGPKYLRKLNLAGNLIETLDGDPFRGHILLMEIILRKNRLSSVKETSFKDQIILSNLDLAGNELQHIWTNGLHPFLWFLDLSHNHFVDIPAEFLSRTPRLLQLNLGYNQISEVPSHALIHLRRLAYLDLSNNNIDIIQQIAFRNLSRILILLLGNNRISSLANGTLKSMLHLTHLDLSRNRISVIQSHYFYNLLNLSFLNLAYNPLREVEERTFFYTPSLKYLNLMFSSMDVLWTDLFSGPRDLVVELQPARTVLNYNLPNDFNLGSVLGSSGYRCTYYDTGSNLCRPCPLGTYSGIEQDCTSCPPGGFYQDEFAYTGRLSHGMGCKLCPVGHYVPPHAAPGKAITECILCPQGTEYSQFAGFKGCECLSNFYRLDRFGPCLRCPLQGLTCQNESVRLQPGFFWKWSSNESLMKYEEFSADLLITNNSYKQLTFQGTIPEVNKCPAAEACLGGMRSGCSHGYEGPLCAVCSTGHYQLLNRCRKCPRLLWLVLQVCGIIIIIAFVAVSIILGKRRKCASNRTVTDMILAQLKIVIGFYQVASGTFNTFSYVEWPSTLLTVVQYANMVQLNLLEIVPLQCFIDNFVVNAYTRLLLVVGSNTAIIFLAVLTYQIRKLVLINIKKLSSAELAESLSSDRTQIYRVVCLLIFVTYPATCTTIFNLLSPTCQRICSNTDSCQYFLRADVSVQCFTDKYNKYVIAVYFLLTLVVIIPVIVLFLLWKYHHRKFNEEAQVQSHKGKEISNGLSFLYENYARQCWFWEILELVRKVWVTSTLFLMGANTRSHLGTAAIISGIYSVLVAYYKPIKDTFEHWLQLVSLVASFITMNVGMLLKIPTEELSSSSFGERDSVFVSVALVAVNVVVVAVLAVHYIYTLMSEIRRLRSKPQCGAECCVTFMMVMVGAGEDATDIDTGGIETSAVSHNIT